MKTASWVIFCFVSVIYEISSCKDITDCPVVYIALKYV